MNLQSGQASELSAPKSRADFGLDTCPTCGQEIPPDKIEEISGKVAAREREQALAISAQLEKQFATQRTEAEAKAKADLELERKQGDARERRAREEAQKAAESLLSERQAETDRRHAEIVAGWQHQLGEAESARKSAEEIKANLQAEMDKVRENSANALEVLKAETKEREKEIQIEARRTAELAAAERIAAVEAAQRESQAGLLARISEMEASRVAANKRRPRLPRSSWSCDSLARLKSQR